MMNTRTLVRGFFVIAVGALAVSPASAAVSATLCAQLDEVQIEKQANPRAARLAAACNGFEVPFAAVEAELGAPTTAGRWTPKLGGSDVNLVTGEETFPNVTQAGSMVWGNGMEVVAVYTDTRDAPASFSGMSVSTDGGITFDRLSPDPFDEVLGSSGGDFGAPAVAYSVFHGLWLAVVLTPACGTQGIGVISLSDLGNPATWALASCASSGDADDRPVVWVDNNSGSSHYGRVYVSFNDFAAGVDGDLKVAYTDDLSAWTTRTANTAFIRNVHLTGSKEADGPVFLFGMNENGGAGANRSNHVYRSIDGGVNWTGPTILDANFPAPGAGLCSASDYFYMVPPVWRHMGWGQGAVGPDGVVHYVYTASRPADLGDIYYVRSSNNGDSWGTPTPLNTDMPENNVVQWLPSISVTSQGYVLVTWYDRRNTTDGLNYQYYGRVSLDNGLTFLPEEPISDVLSPQPTQVDSSTDFCFAGDSNFHGVLDNDALVTWTDGRNLLSDGTKDVEQMDVYFEPVALCPPFSLSPEVLPNGTAGETYAETVTAGGGTPPHTFALSGSLPSTLELAESGDITGTPDAAGITTFSIIATDSKGCEGARQYSLVVDDDPGCATITLDPTALPNGTQGAPYSQTRTASGGSGPYAYAITGGALPNGVTLDLVTGELAGTPTESGDYTFYVTATDTNLCTGTQSYTLTVACAVVTLSPVSHQLPNAFSGVPYVTNITGNGGTAPYKFYLQSAITVGLFMGEGGTIFGVPEQGGSKNFTIQAVDTNGCTGEASFRLDSANCFPGTILCDTMSDPAINFTAVDQCGGEAEWYGTNACPSSDDIGHNPAAHARWGTMGDCNDYGSGASQDSLESESLDVSNCNSGEVILRFDYLLSFEDDATKDRARVAVIADGGAPEVVADNGLGGPTCGGDPSPGIGNLRPWSGWQHLELEIPATSTFEVSFIAETDDGLNNAGEGFFVDDVMVQCKCPDDLAMTPEHLPPGVVDTAYEVTFETTGGAPPYTYDKPKGGNPPPPGLALDTATGLLSGIPTTPGIHQYSVESIDSNYCKVLTNYNLVVSPTGCPAIALAPDTLPDEVEGTFYSQVLTPSGGTGPYVFTVTDGSLPAGLALDPDTGIISGTPNVPGIYRFSVSAVGFNFCLGTQEYTIIINPIGCPVITVSPSVLPNAESGQPFSETLTADGGVTPYAYVISAGALPEGLALDPDTGMISGSPAGSEIFNFAVTAEDANGCFGTETYGLDVVNLPPRVVAVHTVSDTGDGELVDGESTRSSITQLYVTFHEDVQDPVGDLDPSDVTNPANYLVVGRGPNRTFDTSSCASGLAGDDVAVAVDQVTYDDATRTAHVRTNGGVQLLRGWYRLFVCGSTSIRDILGEPLDGDGDLTGGDDKTLDFAVTEDNLLQNPNFDTDLSGWTSSSPSETSQTAVDAGEAPTSGSATLVDTTGPGHSLSVSQCVAISDLTGYYLKGRISVTSSLDTDPTVTAQVQFFDGAACGGNSLTTSALSSSLVGNTSAQGIFCDDFESGDTSTWGTGGGCSDPEAWNDVSGWVSTPAGAVSAMVRFTVDAGDASGFTVSLDDLLFFEMLFGDGFESGDTSAWSAAVQ